MVNEKRAPSKGSLKFLLAQKAFFALFTELKERLLKIIHSKSSSNLSVAICLVMAVLFVGNTCLLGYANQAYVKRQETPATLPCRGIACAINGKNAKPLMSLPYPLRSKDKLTLFSATESSCERVSSSSNNLLSA